MINNMQTPETDKEKSVETAAHVPNSTEADERQQLPTISQISYFHIDDKVFIHTSYQKQLSSKFQIAPTQLLGTARSTQEAIRKIRDLALAQNAPRFILLDQKFLLTEGDEDNKVDDEMASEQFARQYAKLLMDPVAGLALRDTKIIIVSGSDDHEYLAKLQKICPAIVARAPKGEDAIDTLAVVLAEQGIIQDDEKLNNSRKTVESTRLIRTLCDMNESDYEGTKALKEGDHQSNAAIAFLGLINDFRSNVSLEPLATTDKAFAAILNHIQTRNMYVPQELLCAA